MRRYQTQIRLQKWQVDEAQKKLAQLVRLEENLRRDRRRLDEELEGEQVVAASFENRLTYGAYAAQIIVRRERLDRSIDDIAAEVAQARELLRSAFSDLKKFELAAASAEQRARQAMSRKDRLQEDETALNVFRRDSAASA